jgi:hypothetical protein
MKLSETETIDKLFLELSQFTNARTKRELAFEIMTSERCVNIINRKEEPI